MALRAFCNKCLFNSSFKQLTSYQRHGFKSVYSIDKIYPNSNPDILKEQNDLSVRVKNRLETIKPGFTGFIPVEKLEIKSSRGSGPGGQSVNKSNNKVEIRFHVASADWIPDNLKDKFLEQEKNRINKEGYFITMSHKTRKHILNQSDCINKIRTAIYECMIEREPPSEEHLEKLNKRLEKQQRNGYVRKGVIL